MDPEIICGIGSQAKGGCEKNDVEAISENQLRKLDLQWSGNTAVLRAWSEPEGLPSLPHLNEVNIIVPDGILVSEVVFVFFFPFSLSFSLPFHFHI